jgi:hypothetical protein
MSKKLLDLYTSLLATANLVADSEGNVSTVYGEDSKPFVIKGKRVVLPVASQLRNPDWGQRIAFHPMFENVMQEESEVLERYRSALNARINYTVNTLAYDLLILATSTAEHAKLTPDQSVFLSHVKDADEKTLEALKKLLARMPISQTQRQSVVIFLKRGGVLGGRKHARVGVVNFPLYHELKKGEDEIYDVKLRKKDLKTLAGLFEFIFPGIDEVNAYSRASDSQQAPALDALMKAVQAVGDPVNATIDLFANRLDEPDKMRLESGWVEAFLNIDAMMAEARTIPMLSATAAAPLETLPATTLATAVAAKPVYPWNQPPQQPGYGFGHQPQPVQLVQPAQIVKTARGTDFESILRSNPVLQQQLGPAAFTGQPTNPRDGAPRWAPGATFGSGWGGGMGGGWGGGAGGGMGGGYGGGSRF